MMRSDWPTWWTSTKPALVAKASGTRWKDLDPDSRTELTKIMSTLLPVRARRDGMIFDNLVTGPEMLRDQIPFDQIQAPTLVITAEDSPLPKPADAADVVKRLPRGELLVMPGGGHLLLGNVERLRHALMSFLLGQPLPTVDDGASSRDAY
jgi:pimeloyl-ACP methyl ester carboxylesterase